MTYEYTENWIKKDETSGTIQVKEILPAKGQSKNNVRTVDYDCSIEDLKLGLENLKKTRDKSISQYEQEKQKIEKAKDLIKEKNYSNEITPEMEKILKVLENHKLLNDIESSSENLKIHLEQLEMDNKRVEIREKLIESIQ
jgi:hypothetical protein